MNKTTNIESLQTWRSKDGTFYYLMYISGEMFQEQGFTSREDARKAAHALANGLQPQEAR